MWLNNLRINEKKVLSPVEFLVLANCVSDKYIKANEILNNINSQIKHWETTAGTIYPILHRLRDYSLLEEDPNQKLAFKISQKGIEFFISAVCAFEEHYETDTSFFMSIIRSFIKLDPVRAEEILKIYQRKINEFLKDLNDLQKEVEEQKRTNGWVTIPVTFESDGDE